jgi:hypothetical protein
VVLITVRFGLVVCIGLALASKPDAFSATRRLCSN